MLPNGINLVELARLAMLSHGLEPEYPKEALQELERLSTSAAPDGNKLMDLTHLLWCSIDNDDSKDLDQITVAEKLSNGGVKIFVAVADVDTLVKKGDPIDAHARKNTTSVYTGVKTFAMLPLKLSENLTSLSEGEKRIARKTSGAFWSRGPRLHSFDGTQPSFSGSHHSKTSESGA